MGPSHQARRDDHVVCSVPSGNALVRQALGGFVLAYALSPIDLIPDFIPVLGYLDDVILLPVLIWLTIRMLPAEVLDESRRKAEQWFAERGAKPRSWAGAVVIALIWVLFAVVLSLWAITA